MDAKSLHRQILTLNSAGGLYEGSYLNAFGATVQLWHETGNFKHCPGNNFAGIKYRSWQAKYGITSSTLQTTEHVGGQNRRMAQDFAVFRDVGHFLWFYSRLIARLYPMAAKNHDCVWLFFQGLQPSRERAYKWATDPKYLEKLAKVATMLAPDLLGESWRATLRQSLKAARSRGGLLKRFDNRIDRILRG